MPLLFINCYPYFRHLIWYCSSTSVTALILTFLLSCSGNAFCCRRQAFITAIIKVCCDAVLYASSISLYRHSFSLSVVFNSPVSCKDCTGHFIMYSGIRKLYYRKTVGHVFTKTVQTEGTTQKFFPSKLFFIVVHISANR